MFGSQYSVTLCCATSINKYSQNFHPRSELEGREDLHHHLIFVKWRIIGTEISNRAIVEFKKKLPPHVYESLSYPHVQRAMSCYFADQVLVCRDSVVGVPSWAVCAFWHSAYAILQERYSYYYRCPHASATWVFFLCDNIWCTLFTF